jgi:trans-2-enoyl-CoA reductase
VYKVKISPEGENLDLVGHVPIELSRVLAGFLGASETNSLTVKVCGKRKREVGLVVPGCFQARTKRKKVADILNTEIKRIKERYPYFELEIEQEIISTPLLSTTTAQGTK